MARIRNLPIMARTMERQISTSEIQPRDPPPPPYNLRKRKRNPNQDEQESRLPKSKIPRRREIRKKCLPLPILPTEGKVWLLENQSPNLKMILIWGMANFQTFISNIFFFCSLDEDFWLLGHRHHSYQYLLGLQIFLGYGSKQSKFGGRTPTNPKIPWKCVQFERGCVEPVEFWSSFQNGWNVKKLAKGGNGQIYSYFGIWKISMA